MSKILTNNKHYSNIADTIRQMKDVNTTYKPREMAWALRDIYSTQIEDIPPLTFTSNGNNLLNYRIDGANGGVGDRTANLFDFGEWSKNINVNRDNSLAKGIDGITITANSNDAFTLPYSYAHNGVYKIYVKPNTNYLLSWVSNNNLYGRVIIFKNGISDNTHMVSVNNNTTKYLLFGTDADTEFITLRFGVETTGNTITYSKIMLNEGSTALPYEPYGYKIPVVCGGTTTNIYIDEPIREDESISMEEANVNIPTIDGTNIISIDTTVQPSKVYVQAPRTNNLPIEVIEQATAEGESLNLTNTKAMPYSDYVVKGKSEQEGEPSPSNPSEIHSVADDVNLLNNTATSQVINGITYTVNEDKSVVANGTATAHSILNLYGNLTISAGTYTFSGCPSNGSWSTYSMGFGSKNDSGNGVTFTETSDFTGQPYIRIANGTTVNNLIFRPKIQKGSTPTPYSPYNQGTVTIKQRGKNKFTISNFQKSGWNIAIDNPLKDFNSGQYTISCVNAYKENLGIAIAFSNQPFDGIIGNYFTGYNFGNGTKYNNTQTITQEHINAEYMRLMPSDNGVTQEILENMQIQLEQGTQATDYEPYQANDYTFQTEPLRSLPNGVKDTIEADGIHRRVGRIVLDGSENWTSYTVLQNNIAQGGITLSPKAKSRIGYCNNFPVVADYSSTEHIVIAGGLTAVYIHIDQTRFSTQDLAGFKEWLSNNPVILQYELAEEIIEPLTQNQATTMLDIIKTGSYEGTTNIYTDEDVKPTIGVGYYKKA